MAPQVELLERIDLTSHPAISLRTHPGLCDVFLKIGGSILDDEAATARLVPHLVAAARERRIMIMAGGGRAAKRIKANQRAFGTDFRKCWKGAVLTLEVNVRLLASYSPSLEVVNSLEDIRETMEAGRIAVLAPVKALKSSLHLIPNWIETTDSIGLYFAHIVGAQRYVVVSDVNGIYRTQPGEGETYELPIQRLKLDELEQLPSSKLDSAFPMHFRRYPLPTFIVNGKHPERVGAVTCGRPTTCTEIVCNPSRPVATEQLSQCLQIP
jgi:aspartokinase-like uncharacterized kinase